MNTRPFDGCSTIAFDDVSYLYLNDDNPVDAYNTRELSFVAQPLSRLNKKYNVVVVPLMMTDMWRVLKEHPDLLEELRSNDKKYDFCFIGGCEHADRNIFRNLQLESYLFRETTGGFLYNEQDESLKLQTIVNFLHELSQCKFVFAPRGVGSSSFRLYESMSVGAVPIITGQPDFPFREFVNWNDMSLFSRPVEGVRYTHGLNQLITRARDMSVIELQAMRQNAIEFWDKYCRHDVLYNNLKRLYHDDF